MLHVNGGTGHNSYASNSLFQGKAISMTWPIAKEAITEFLCGGTNFPTTLTIADLGCSSGPNTLTIVSNLIKQAEEIHKKLHKKPLQYQVFFNDLHGNDFNALFASLPSFFENLKTQMGADFGPCFFNGVPGSFYDRLFPTKSLHFVYSSYSLHWLSQVPKGIGSNNKGNVFISPTTPNSVVQAYYIQFQKDFSMFLKCRAEELISGGRMVLTMLGRTTEDPSTEDSWGFLTSALNSMVSEGIVEAEKVDTFNMPYYMPCPWEVKIEVLNEGSFTMDRLEISKINCNLCNAEFDLSSNTSIDSSYYVARNIRSVVEPLLIHHFGEAIMEELFWRYKKIIEEHMSRENIEYVNLTVSLTKK